MPRLHSCWQFWREWATVTGIRSARTGFSRQSTDNLRRLAGQPDADALVHFIYAHRLFDMGVGAEAARSGNARRSWRCRRLPEATSQNGYGRSPTPRRRLRRPAGSRSSICGRQSVSVKRIHLSCRAEAQSRFDRERIADAGGGAVERDSTGPDFRRSLETSWQSLSAWRGDRTCRCGPTQGRPAGAQRPYDSCRPGTGTASTEAVRGSRRKNTKPSQALLPNDPYYSTLPGGSPPSPPEPTRTMLMPPINFRLH